LTPIPVAARAVYAWRIDGSEYAATWNSGFGAALRGGRWNRASNAVVYASLDPATTILEKAVHAGFAILDTVAHTMTKFVIEDIDFLDVIEPRQIANPNWLRPGVPNLAQQDFLTSRLANASKPFVAIPSVISPESWNIVFDPFVAAGKYTLVDQKTFALDQRLSP
jgi:RES domain-containing protein